MEKIKLYNVGNSGKYCFYTFDKTQKVHKILSEIFHEIFDIHWPTTKTVDETENTKEVPTNISKYEDFHETLQLTTNEFDTKKRIDVFYGKKRMFITIHCSQKLRKQFNEKLKEISEFPDIKTDEKQVTQTI